MTREKLTVAELREAIEGVPDDETVHVGRSGALGDATKVYRNVEGVVIKSR